MPIRFLFWISTPPARSRIEGIHAETLARRIGGTGKPGVSYVPSFEDAAERAVAVAQPCDLILTLGAGSVSQLGAVILEMLEKRSLVVSR